MLSHFSISQCGESHYERGDDCQDASFSKSVYAQRFNAEYVVAVIADGVGSCDFSKEGANKAVESFVACVEHNLVNGTTKKNDEGMLHILEHSFKWALKSVNELSKEEELPFGLLDSTLTGIIYDGATVWFGHAGDDGIVAMHNDGSYEAITRRHEGEEPGSVRPLRNHATWEFGVSQDVASLVLMTDGVYDKCVGSDSFGARVRLPFLRPLLYAEIDSDDMAKQLRKAWDAFLNTPPNNVKINEGEGYVDRSLELSEKDTVSADSGGAVFSEVGNGSKSGYVPTIDEEPSNVDSFVSDSDEDVSGESSPTHDESFSALYGGPGFEQMTTPPRNYISDDITVVLVSNSDSVRNLPEYYFDEDAFDAETERIRLETEQRLAEISQQRWKEQRERELRARERASSHARKTQASTPAASAPAQPFETENQSTPVDATASSAAVHGRRDSNTDAQPTVQYVSMRSNDGGHLNRKDSPNVGVQPPVQYVSMRSNDGKRTNRKASDTARPVSSGNYRNRGTKVECRVESSTSMDDAFASFGQAARAFRSGTASALQYLGEKLAPKPEEYESRGDESGGRR